jgi:hypothetical protein
VKLSMDIAKAQPWMPEAVDARHPLSPHTRRLRVRVPLPTRFGRKGPRNLDRSDHSSIYNWSPFVDWLGEAFVARDPRKSQHG